MTRRACRRIVVGAAVASALWLAPAAGFAQWLPAPCQPSSPETQAVLDALRQMEARTPPHRVAAAAEAPMHQVSAERMLAAANAPDGAEVAAVVTWLRWIAPDEVAGVGALAEREPPCGHEGVALLAALDELERDAVDAVVPWIALVYAHHQIPEAATQRLAVHAFLATHAPLLDALAAGEAMQSRPSDATARGVRALAQGARGDAAGMAALLPPVLEGVEEAPWWLWIRAESARQSGAPADAIALAEQALNADPLFAAAIFTRASALIRTGGAELVLSDVEHLRRTFGPDGPYATWTNRLDRRLAR